MHAARPAPPHARLERPLRPYTKSRTTCAACRPRRDWSYFVDILDRGNVGITIYRYRRPVHDSKVPLDKQPKETLIIYTTKNINKQRDTGLDIYTTNELPKCAKYCPRCKELMRRVELLYRDASAAEREAGLSELFSCPPCTDIVHKFRKFRDATLEKQDSELIHLMRQTSPRYDGHVDKTRMEKAMMDRTDASKIRMLERAMTDRTDASSRYDAHVDVDQSRMLEKAVTDASQIRYGVRSTKSVVGRARFEDTKSEALLKEAADKDQRKTEKASAIDLKQKSSKFLKIEGDKDKSTKSDGKITSRSRSKVEEDQEKENENVHGKDYKMGKDSKYGDGKYSKSGIVKNGKRGDGIGTKYGDGKDSKSGIGKDGKRGDGKESKYHGLDKDSKIGDGKHSMYGKASKFGTGKVSKHGDGTGSKHGDGTDSKYGDDKDSKYGDDKYSKRQGVGKDSKHGKDSKLKSSSLSTILVKETSSNTKPKSDSLGKPKSTAKLGNKNAPSKKDKEMLLFEKTKSIRLKIEEHMRKKLEADQKQIDKSRKDIDTKMQNATKAEHAEKQARAHAEEARQLKFKAALELVAVEEPESVEALTDECSDRPEVQTIIKGEKIYKCYKPCISEREAPAGELVRIHSPMTHLRHPLAAHTQPVPTPRTDSIEQSPISTVKSSRFPSGAFSYSLSERKFVHKGWTQLPKEMVMRKVAVFRMLPSPNEFCWFTLHRDKGRLLYDTRQLMAAFEDDGAAKLYYRSGELAMEIYNAEDPSAAGRRVVVYSKKSQDKRAPAQSVLAVFDYSGNGCVFDHSGHTRLKYSQNEGIVLDRSIGPHTHWKWHNLNESSRLHTVLIEHQLTFKDPTISRLTAVETPAEITSDEIVMRTIESQNIINENRTLVKKFSPYQIKMKAFKLNDHFSLRIIEQSSVFLMFTDGKTRLKMNVGMVLDPTGIVGEDFVQLGEVQVNIEKTPACSESLERLHRVVHGARAAERAKLLREQRLNPPVRRATVPAFQASNTIQRRYT